MNYSQKTEVEILQHASLLEGRNLKYIQKESKNNDESINTQNKGSVGLFIEKYWFGIDANSSEKPDFEKAAIELKVCPLKKTSKQGFKTKERTKICMINYEKLVKEQWKKSHARKKLNKILFIFYEFDKENWNKQRVIAVRLWSVNQDEKILEYEWEKTYKIVSQGNAHKLSEKGYQALAPSTAGTGREIKQPFNSILAKERAFSLKQSFVNQYWESIKKNPVSFESLLDTLNLKSAQEIEYKLTEIFDIYVGMSLGEIAKKNNIKIKLTAKNAVPIIFKNIIGLKSHKSKIKEFEQFGIQIKTVPVNKNNSFMPYEAMSFPAISLEEFSQEENYYDSDLYNYLSRIFIIPIHRNTRNAKSSPIEKRTLERPFFWSPSDIELDIIQKEWKNYQNEVKDGKAKVIEIKNGRETTGLTKSKDTEIIHMRPHASNNQDRDCYKGNSIVKQSFWLNTKFVQKIIQESNNRN